MPYQDPALYSGVLHRFRQWDGGVGSRWVYARAGLREGVEGVADVVKLIVPSEGRVNSNDEGAVARRWSAERRRFHSRSGENNHGCIHMYIVYDGTVIGLCTQKLELYHSTPMARGATECQACRQNQSMLLINIGATWKDGRIHTPE
ncbi:hypothetical protein B0H19DRAFT_1235606 [Mycena capillaripes]|nr:hypothetical protein B0H19DRAFT_1235606 [Mycena capillaripes]